MANTVDLTSMSEYIRQNADELFVKSTIAPSLDYIDIMLNVKGKEALNYLDSEVVLQGGSCGWNPQASDFFSQRFIQVHPVVVEKEFCYFDFQHYVSNEHMKFQAGLETLGSWEEKIALSNVEAIRKAVDEMVWKGNSGASVTGLLADAAEASAATVSFASGDTTIAKVDALVAAITPEMLSKGVNIYMSFTDYRNYVLESNGTCCAGRPVLDAASSEIVYASDSRIRLIPMLGLENTGKIVAATKLALVYATDIDGSETAYRWTFDEKENKFLFYVLFAAGTAIRFPDEVIVGSAE